MVNKRLINCDFIKDMEVPNKALLLYLVMFINADDMGFVGKANKLVAQLDSKEDYTIGLCDYKYGDALIDLVNKGLLMEFTNNHGDKIYLLRQWFYHNKHLDLMETNYNSLLDLVELVDNEYNLLGEERILEGRETKKGKERKRKEEKRREKGKKYNNSSLISKSSNCSSSCDENDNDDDISREELIRQLEEDDDTTMEDLIKQLDEE